MRILIIAGYFPPRAPLSATRVASLAKFLVDRGHDIRVIAARNSGHFPALQPEVPAGSVFFTRKPDLGALGRLLARSIRGLRRARTSLTAAAHGDSGGKVAGRPAPRASSGSRSRLYDAVVYIPDAHAGWIPSAIARGRALIRDWRPDLIYASAPPHSGLLVAARLARASGIPWFAELRDLWVDHGYYDAPRWRRRIDAAIERWALSSVTGIVTVTGAWARLLEEKYHKPTVLVMNGYDADDYGEPGAGNVEEPERLTIRYTGGIYPGKRDPSPLFDALSRLEHAEERFRVEFQGEDMGGIGELARHYGVERLVELSDPVAHAEAVIRQKTADVLLLLRWRDPAEASVIPGKLFEYLGAGRPILCLGHEQGEAVDIIRQESAGIVTNDPEVISEQLVAWQRTKAASGSLPAPPRATVRRFTREGQFTKLEASLQELVASSRKNRA